MKKEQSLNTQRPYIGLAGIYDYEIFWNEMKKNIQFTLSQGEVVGLKGILSHNIIKANYFNWNDTGNINNLKKTRRSYFRPNQPNILEKEEEKIWFSNSKVLKLTKDIQYIRNRFLRSKKIKNYIPKIIGVKKNMYAYNFVEGKIFSKTVNRYNFSHLLRFSKKFWKTKKLSKFEIVKFRKNCMYFYKNKTQDRISLFYKKFEKKDGEEFINDLKMPKLSELLKKIDWVELSKGVPVRFHGDFHLENILYNQKNKKFLFLIGDKDFNGNLEIGDFVL